MGDRTGLPKLDRTNGYEDGRDYMKVKKMKLAAQNDQIREALRHRNQMMRTDIFKNISVNVNGRTQPTADEIKRLILLNGGEYHPYYRYQSTKFMIATNLSIARTKNLRPDDRIVKPEWITDSVKAKCLLPYEDYQLFANDQQQQHQNNNGLFRQTLSAPTLPASTSRGRPSARTKVEDTMSKKQLSITDFFVRNPNPKTSTAKN